VVEIEEVSQTSSEGTRHIIQFSSSNIKDEEHVHIENNLNLITPLLIVPTFGILEWIIEKGWAVLPKKRRSGKWTP